MGVVSDAANLPRRDSAVRRFEPVGAGVIAAPHAVSTGAGHDVPRVVRRGFDIRDFPAFEVVVGDGPPPALLSDRQHSVARSKIEDCSHGRLLLISVTA